MERKIGEILEYNGEWYQCVECDSCGECSLRTTECRNGTKSDIADEIFGECSKVRRPDNKHAIFKKVKKVGEPITIKDRTFQKLTSDNASCKECVFNIPNKACCKNDYVEGICDNGFWIEIKQNKEDMEENKTNFVEEIEVLCKRYNMSDGVRTDFISEVKEIIKDKDKKHSLKPFDLEAAKLGKPVCTRDGRKARIVCFDRVTNSTNEYTGRLIVLITNPNGDEQSFYYTEKGNLAGEDEYDNHKYDLMMLSEKKEGWLNLYPADNPRYAASAGCAYIYRTQEQALSQVSEQTVATVKVEWEE